MDVSWLELWKLIWLPTDGYLHQKGFYFLKPGKPSRTLPCLTFSEWRSLLAPRVDGFRQWTFSGLLRSSYRLYYLTEETDRRSHQASRKSNISQCLIGLGCVISFPRQFKSRKSRQSECYKYLQRLFFIPSINIFLRFELILPLENTWLIKNAVLVQLCQLICFPKKIKILKYYIRCNSLTKIRNGCKESLS